MYVILKHNIYIYIIYIDVFQETNLYIIDIYKWIIYAYALSVDIPYFTNMYFGISFITLSMGVFQLRMSLFSLNGIILLSTSIVVC